MSKLSPTDMLSAFDGYYEPPENPGDAMLEHIEASGYMLVQRPEVEQRRDPERYVQQYRMVGYVGNELARAEAEVSEQVIAVDGAYVADMLHKQLVAEYGRLIVNALIPKPEKPRPGMSVRYVRPVMMPDGTFQTVPCDPSDGYPSEPPPLPGGDPIRSVQDYERKYLIPDA